MSEIYTKMYIEVRGSFTNENIIVLNRRYTREQIRTAMEEQSFNYGKEWIDEVVTKGIYIQEGENIVIKCKGDECSIQSGYTPYRAGYSISYIHKKDKVELYPNATFKRIYHYTILDILFSMVDKYQEFICSFIKDDQEN